MHRKSTACDCVILHFQLQQMFLCQHVIKIILHQLILQTKAKLSTECLKSHLLPVLHTEMLVMNLHELGKILCRKQCIMGFVSELS